MKSHPLIGREYTKLGLGDEDRILSKETQRIRNLILAEVTGAVNSIPVKCLCGTNKGETLISQIDRWGIPVSIVLCNNCGLGRLNPRWSEDFYVQVYKKYYTNLLVGSTDISTERFNLSLERAKPFSDELLQRIAIKNKDILEIGCSYGAGLAVLKGNKANLVGYDYNKKIIDVGKKYTGLDLRCGGLDSALQHNQLYDIVILRHVFEHFFEPINAALSLKKLLKKDGVIFIEVPGLLSQLKQYAGNFISFDVFHPFYYTKKTLTHVMNHSGYTEDDDNDENIYSMWKVSKSLVKVDWSDEDEVLKIKKTIRKTTKTIFRKEKKDLICRFLSNFYNHIKT